MKRMVLGMMVWMTTCGLALGALTNPSFETTPSGTGYAHEVPPGWYCPTVNPPFYAMQWGVWGTASEGTQCLWCYGAQQLAQIDQTQLHTGDHVSMTWASRGQSFDMILVLMQDPTSWANNANAGTYVLLETQTVPASADGVTWIDYGTATYTVDAAHDGWYPGVSIWTTGNNPTIGVWRIVDNVRVTITVPPSQIIGTVQMPDYSGDLQDVLVRIELIQNQTVMQTYRKTLDTNGHFSVDNVTPDTYDIAVRAYAHLQTVRNNVTLVGGTNDLGNIPLAGGNCNGDNAITEADLSIILTNMDEVGQ